MKNFNSEEKHQSGGKHDLAAKISIKAAEKHDLAAEISIQAAEKHNLAAIFND